MTPSEKCLLQASLVGEGSDRGADPVGGTSQCARLRCVVVCTSLRQLTVGVRTVVPVWPQSWHSARPRKTTGSLRQGAVRLCAIGADLVLPGG